MSLPRPYQPDALRPTERQALDAWRTRVRADREQVERLREIDDPSDYYAPVANRFRADPYRKDDPVLDHLLALARPEDRWVDIGAGGGRYALPLAMKVRELVAVEPSPGMREVLATSAAEHGIDNLAVRDTRWPPMSWIGRDGIDPEDHGDVALLAHVGYDIEDIGTFLDAAEAAARRLCVAVTSEGAMTTVATLFWQPVHGEPRVLLPALPELLAVLIARGRLPEVHLAGRIPSVADTLDDLVNTARRQLWVRPGSEKDQRLLALVRERATQRDGRWALEWSQARIGVVTWVPRDPPWHETH
ncbi:MAG: hypothetical protein U0869_12390 [Chloroflexota bacterium]